MYFGCSIFTLSPSLHMFMQHTHTSLLLGVTIDKSGCTFKHEFDEQEFTSLEE